MNDEERELVLRAQQGDQWAFEQLVGRYDRRVLSLAYDMVGHPEDAQDIYQEALVAAYKNLPRFRLESDFFTWMYRIAVNKALKFRRRYRKRMERAAEELQEGRMDATTPEGALLEAEFREQLAGRWRIFPGRSAWPLCCVTTRGLRSARRPS